MSGNSWLQLIVFAGVLLACVKPLGHYMPTGLGIAFPFSFRTSSRHYPR